jgi:hypothetical protein
MDTVWTPHYLNNFNAPFVGFSTAAYGWYSIISGQEMVWLAMRTVSTITTHTSATTNNNNKQSHHHKVALQPPAPKTDVSCPLFTVLLIIYLFIEKK